jgi:hypothetical protein
MSRIYRFFLNILVNDVTQSGKWHVVKSYTSNGC